MTSKKKEEKSC